MRRIEIDGDPGPEIVVQITWRQWEDGHWEAWLVDESGLPPYRVRSRVELASFFEQACGRGRPEQRSEPGSDDR